ncbi:MAG: hypothetical protein LBH44_14520 [Treponema sp.]|jgi:hypothetical protein|nr:hypothetical protein [Treponema sp.]
MKTSGAYQKIVLSLKRRKNGATVADVCAATALPLSTVSEFLPKAADEYSGRLQVTESGEILYTFPNGFTSRYRGFYAALKKAAGGFSRVMRSVLTFLFKAWIMVMLVGYFVFFIALVILSIAAAGSSKNRSSSRSGTSLFNFLWRVWFYNEVARPRYRKTVKREKQTRPIHKAVFSFVFGEDEPNKDWEEKERKAIIAYIQANNGVISLPEYMAFSGQNSLEAEDSILAFCVQFSGSPEATEEGTIVYRFDELLLRADSAAFSELSPPVKQLKTFSSNTKSTNVWFTVLNAVNLFFGSYFLYHSVATGLLITPEQYQAASYLYAFTHMLFQTGASDPVTLLKVALGFVPLIFSLFFWLIPAMRFFSESKENDEIKLSNFKRFGFGKIWSTPLNVEIKDLSVTARECCPRNMAAAGEQVVKDMGAVSSPDIEIGEKFETKYSFRELEAEKRALEKYRNSLNPGRTALGETVFDSGE